jgi:hypothetical protein
VGVRPGPKQGILAQAKVQPVTLLDPQDFEQLMGLVEAGRDLSTILAGKTAEPYHDLELAVYLNDAPGAPRERPRPAASEALWQDTIKEATRCSTSPESHKRTHPSRRNATDLVELVEAQPPRNGGGGIRTLGSGVTRSTAFKAAAFNRSATPPRRHPKANRSTRSERRG